MEICKRNVGTITCPSVTHAAHDINGMPKKELDEKEYNARRAVRLRAEVIASARSTLARLENAAADVRRLIEVAELDAARVERLPGECLHVIAWMQANQSHDTICAVRTVADFVAIETALATADGKELLR